jgi:hypothetical protein
MQYIGASIIEDMLPSNGTNVAIVGDYQPTNFDYRPDKYWAKRHTSLDEHRMDKMLK